MSSDGDLGADVGDGVVSTKEKGEMRLITRSAAVLRALTQYPNGASLGELAKATTLARSTVQRVVDALALEGFVTAGGAANSIRLGLELARLASFVQQGPREQFRPFMEDLMSRVQETVDLTMLGEQGDVIVIDQLTSNYSLRVASHIGQRLPLVCSASGKAHLSQLDPARRRALAEPAITRLTANTKTDIARALDEIDRGAERGLFVDEEEYAEGVCALAISAPLPVAGNFAIAIPMPATRFSGRREASAQHLLEVRAAMMAASRRLGPN